MRRGKWPSGPSCATDHARSRRGCRAQAPGQGAGPGVRAQVRDQAAGPGSGRYQGGSEQRTKRCSEPPRHRRDERHTVRPPPIQESGGSVRSGASPELLPALLPPPLVASAPPRSPALGSGLPPAFVLRSTRWCIRRTPDGVRPVRIAQPRRLDGGNPPDGPHPGWGKNARGASADGVKTRGCGRRGGMLGMGGSTRR